MGIYSGVSGLVKGSYKVARWGVNGTLSSISHYKNKRALINATNNGDVDALTSLIKTGANLNILDSNNATLLHIAATNGHASCVNALIQSNTIDIEATLQDGKSALHCASENGHTKVLDILVQAGAKIDAKLDNGNNALHLAAAKGHKDGTQFILSKNETLVNEIAQNGQTPMHYAIINKHNDALKVLIDSQNVDFNIQDNEGLSPLFVAIKHSNLDAIDALLSKKLDLLETKAFPIQNSPLHYAVECGNAAVTEKIAILGPQLVNETNLEGYTPLALAAKVGFTDALPVLTQKGCSLLRNNTIRTTDKFYEGNITLLMIAAGHNQTAMVEELINQAPSLVNQKSKFLNTALHFAAKCGAKEACALLLKNGEKPNEANFYGTAPARLAIDYKHLECRNLIQEAIINQSRSNHKSIK